MSKITFIIPNLFSKHCKNILDDSNQQRLLELSRSFSRAKKINQPSLQKWLSNYFQINENYLNSASLMAIGEGLVDSFKKQEKFWLRADPVMLAPTHNGILCRGNRVLELTKDERISIESFVNDYLKSLSMEFKFSNSRQAYVTFSDAADCKFTALDKVVGQDITHRLPEGVNNKFWHGLLTDLQMLLHNCEVNRQREEKQLPTINGLWFWGESHLMPLANQNTDKNLFTDDVALAGAIGKLTNLAQLGKKFNLEAIENTPIIYISEFSEALNQNDMQGWQELFRHWVGDWLLAAIAAVDAKQLDELTLMTDDGHSYCYTRFSNWCFWRKHSFESNLKD